MAEKTGVIYGINGPVVTIKGVKKASDDESFSALAEAFRLESSEC